MTQMSENVRAFLSMRDAWTSEVGKNQFSKAVRIINSAYLFRRNNFDYNDWQQLVAITKSPLYEQQFADMISRTKAKILNTSMDVLSWYIIHQELNIASWESECDSQKIWKRLSNIRKDMFSKADWEKLIKEEKEVLARDFLINHFGEEFVKSLPSLKFRQAVIAGKALVSDMPIMFKVPNIDEASNINQTPPQQVVTETISLAEGTEGVIVPEETKIFQANTDFNIE